MNFDLKFQVLTQHCITIFLNCVLNCL